MLDQLFLTVNEWMTGGVMIAAVGCFLWGMISVAFSPCHLASIPLMVTYVAGQNQVLRPAHAARYAIAGSSAAMVRRILENGNFQQGSLWFRRLAGVAIAIFGIYFIIRPFMGA